MAIDVPSDVEPEELEDAAEGKKKKRKKKGKDKGVAATDGQDGGEPAKKGLVTPTRRSFLLGAVASGIAVPAAMSFTAADPPRVNFTQDVDGLNPAKAYAALQRGNSRFVKMKAVDPNLNAERRIAVSKGQHPFAAIIGCVDSRVAPELVFDRGLGDLFVARVAGNIADDTIVGSIEFGVNEFDIPLVMVLGHTKCGAVTATVKALADGETEEPGQIGSIVEKLTPAAEGGATVDEAIVNNVKLGVEALQASPILGQRIEFGVLKVIGAVYNIETGVVDFSTVPY